jgi:hypothetical protein
MGIDQKFSRSCNFRSEHRKRSIWSGIRTGCCGRRLNEHLPATSLHSSTPTSSSDDGSSLCASLRSLLTSHHHLHPHLNSHSHSHSHSHLSHHILTPTHSHSPLILSLCFNLIHHSRSSIDLTCGTAMEEEEIEVEREDKVKEKKKR